MDDTIVKIYWHLFVDEDCCCQFRPLLRVVPVVIADNNTTSACIFYVLQHIRT